MVTLPNKAHSFNTYKQSIKLLAAHFMDQIISLGEVSSTGLPSLPAMPR
jgi:hypothetical protein